MSFWDKWYAGYLVGITYWLVVGLALLLWAVL